MGSLARNCRLYRPACGAASAENRGESDVAQFQRFEDSAGPIPDAEFGKDARGVVLDGTFRRAKCLGDLTVAVTAGDQAEDFDLTRGQWICPTRRRCSRRCGNNSD